MLSSLNKLSRYTGLSVTLKTGGNAWLGNRQKLISWATALTAAFERYCRRNFLIASQTEYFDTQYRQLQYFPASVPVLSVTSLYSDVRGQYAGNESLVPSDQYHLGLDGNSIVLNFPVAEASRGLRAVLVGGLAYHPVQSTYVVEDVSGTISAGQYATNGSACGIVVSYSSLTLVMENLYGVFAAGDDLTFAESEESLYQDGAALSDTATIASITQQSLAEAFPDLERAVEVEARFSAAHQSDFENVSTMNDQTTRRQSTVYQTPILFQPETLQLLNRFVRPYL